MLSGKNILLGVSGGIAAYKTTFLVRLLIKAGAQVKVVMTQSASSFVSPLTLSTLSKNPVLMDFINEEDGSLSWNNHVELGLWADVMLHNKKGVLTSFSKTFCKISDIEWI